MIKEQVIIGIDTSNYTTSVALLGLDGRLIANEKILLEVKPGERGLRQSEALFNHTVNLPMIMKNIEQSLVGKEIVAVGVSSRPRNQDGSYMPCFLAGVSAAQSIASTLGVPFYRFSHQCGHIMAAVYSSGQYDLLDGRFAAFHISGGTTELVHVCVGENGFDADIVGETADLNAGQVIDRVGVYIGLPFPAGPSLEKEALKNTSLIPKKKISIKDMRINLSGLENLAIKLFDESGNVSLTSAFVLDYIGRAILRLMEDYEQKYGKSRFLCAGGVMSNSIIKKKLSEKFEVYFAEPALSSDNAVGVAALTLREYKSELK